MSDLAAVRTTFLEDALAVIEECFALSLHIHDSASARSALQRALVVVDNVCEPAAVAGCTYIGEAGMALRTEVRRLLEERQLHAAHAADVFARRCSFILGLVVAAYSTPEYEMSKSKEFRARAQRALDGRTKPAPSVPTEAIFLHDLRSPLGVVKTSAEHLLEAEPAIRTGDALDTVLRRIVRQADKGLAFVDEVLTRRASEGKAPAFTIESIAVAPLLETVFNDFQPLAASRGVQLKARVHASVTVAAHRAQLVQVLDNLIGNALKHTPRGGSVTVTCRATRIGQQMTALSARLFRVIDTGSGIAPEQLPFIFLEGVQTRASDGANGYGLGLAIAKRICELHGGTIWARSKLGRGTTISFLIPNKT